MSKHAITCFLFMTLLFLPRYSSAMRVDEVKESVSSDAPVLRVNRWKSPSQYVAPAESEGQTSEQSAGVDKGTGNDGESGTDNGALRKSATGRDFQQADVNGRTQAVNPNAPAGTRRGAPQKGVDLKTVNIESLCDIASDNNNSAQVRLNALRDINAAAAIRPGLLDQSALNKLSAIATNNKNSEDLRNSALQAIGTISAANPSIVTQGLVDAVAAIALDAGSSNAVRMQAVTTLTTMAKAKPDAITEPTVAALARLATGSASASTELSASAQKSLVTLAQNGDGTMASRIVSALSSILYDKNASDAVRTAAANILVRLDGLAGTQFGAIFGKLCEQDAAFAARLYTNNIGFAADDQAAFIAKYIFIPNNMTTDEIGLLISAKGSDGKFVLSDSQVIDFFCTWTKQRGGTNPWDGAAITALIHSPRAQQLFNQIFSYPASLFKDGLTNPGLSQGDLVKMQSQLLLSLFTAVQSGAGADKASAVKLLNDNAATLGIDKDAGLTASHTQDEWKAIASNGNLSSATRACALSQITDEAYLYNYMFKTDSSGTPSINQNVTSLEFAGIVRTGLTAKWYGTLKNKDDRTAYVKLILAVDTTNLKKYIFSDGLCGAVNSLNQGQLAYKDSFVCGDFALQFLMNSIGTAGNGNVTIDSNLGAAENIGYTVPTINYGIPANVVLIQTANGGGHVINAVFVGDDPSNAAQQADSSNWMFIEPQADSEFSFATFPEPIKALQIITQGNFTFNGSGSGISFNADKSIDFQILSK